MNIYCVVPTWKEYPTEAVESIKIQKQQSFRTIIGIDEATHDVFSTTKETVLLSSINRCYAALNIDRCIKYTTNIKDEDIICLVDGDDRLFDEWSLVEVFKAHNLGAWITYGSYYSLSDYKENGETAKKHRGTYRNDENYRKLMWRASHLKTFRYGLYRRLKKDWYIGPDGEPLRVCSDLALMFPMMEMAGKEHIKHINRPIYIYNDMSPHNDHKVRGKEQKEIEYWLRFQEPYHKIHSLSGIGENLR